MLTKLVKMLWIRRGAKKLNNRERIIAATISALVMAVLIISLILIPSQKQTSGASLTISPWSLRGDFMKNYSSTNDGSTTTSNITVSGASDSDDADIRLTSLSSAGTIGATSTGLRYQTPSSQKAKWMKLRWDADVPSGTTLKVAFKTSDSDWGGTYTSLQTLSNGNNLSDDVPTSIDLTSAGLNLTASTRIEMKVELTSAGVNNPVLRSLKLEADTLEAPGSGNISLYRSDGTTQISVPDSNGGYSNETSVKVKATSLSGLADSTGLTLEVDKAESPSYTYDGTADGSATVSSGSATATVSSLSVDKSYKLRVRLKDTQGRYSAWTNFNDSNKAVSIEQTSPVAGAVSINSAATYATSAAVTVSSSATDTGTISSGLDKMMVSEDSTFTNALLGDTTWQTYTTSRSFTLSSTDGAKTVYVKFKDKAGNTSTEFTGLSETFTSTTYKDATNTTADWNTTVGEVGLPSTYNWVQISPATNPAARYDYAMAYDSARQKTVMFGGMNSDQMSSRNDTWEYNGTTWTQISPATSPSIRWSPAMVYDSARAKTVMFGGMLDKSDTWEYNGTTWTQISPATTPISRGDHAMVYDSARAKTVMTSGYNTSSGQTIHNDTYEYNGTNWTGSTGPGTMYNHSMAYDSARSKTVLNYNGTTKEYNGTSWSTVSTTGPSSRANSAMAYDSARGKTILFGGGTGLNDTWEWNGTSWTQATPSTSPPVRYSHSMVYDSARQRIVLFGGRWTYPTFYNDTWEYRATFQTPKNAQSLALDSTSSNITKATLTAGKTTPTGTSLSYYLSANGGTNWEGPVTSGTEWTFTNTGSDLRFKATLSTSDTTVTPSIQDISVSYKINSGSDSITLDTANPSAISGFSAKDQVGGTTLTGGNWYTYYQLGLKPYFAWSASTDSGAGIAGYNVYFGTSSSDTAASNGTFQTGLTYSPTSATSGEVYYLKIASKDNAGNFSSSEQSFTYKLDNTAPNVSIKQSDSSALSVTASTDSATKVRASWPRAYDDSYANGGGISSYTLYRKLSTDADIAGSYTAIASGASIIYDGSGYYYDDTSIDDQMYNYKIKATDVTSNTSGFSAMSNNGYVVDSTGPSTPASTTATALSNGTSITVGWARSTDNVAVTGYNVYRTTNSLSPLPGVEGSSYSLIPDPVIVGDATLSFLNTGLTDYTRYYYRVQAYDASGNTSGFSESSTATTSINAQALTPDVTSPATPAFTTENGSNGYSASRNDLAWSAPTDLSNDATSAGSGLSGYNIYRSASGYNANTYLTVGDLPVSPTFDATPINGASLEADTAKIDTGLDAYTWYAYKIKAYDSATPKNASADSSIIWVRTKQATQPVGTSSEAISVQPTGDPTSNSAIGHQLTITFNGGASRNDTLDTYEIYRATSNYATDASWLASATKIKTFTSTDMLPREAGTISTIPYFDDDTGTSYSYTDTGLSDNTTYYYRVRVTDYIASAGGTFDSWTATAISDTTKDVTPPSSPASISVVDLSPSGTISAIASYPMLAVHWPHIAARVGHPSGGSDSVFKEYRLYRSTDTTFTAGEMIYYGTNNYYVDYLVGNQDYYYKVTSADGTSHDLGGGITKNNESTSTGPVADIINPTTIDKAAPALLNRTQTILANKATIDLSFDEPAEVSVDTGTSSTSFASGVSKTDRAASQSIVLDKLTPNTTYYYRIIARDSRSNKLTSAVFSFDTPEFKVTDIEKDVDVNTVAINWKTNAASDSFVKYTNTENDETRTVADDEALATSRKHGLVLKGLSSSTKYNYQIVSKDDFANRAVKDGTFETEEFKVNTVDVSTTASTATITWETNESSDSFVKYGLKDINEKIASADEISKTHKVLIANLKPSTKYKFKVKSKDEFSNITAASDSDSTFETKPFKIIDVKTDASTNSSTVTWKTNIESTSLVEYKGEKESVSQVAGDDSKVKDHSVEINDLKSATAYSFKIKSRDKDDNITESEGILSFRTKNPNTGFEVKPNASKVAEQELTATSAKIAWTTAAPTSSWVEYGETTKYGKLAGNDTLTVDHVITLENLTPGKTYHYRAKGVDADGNEFISADNTFTALVEPKIVGAPAAKTTNESVVITFKTNTDTDSIIEYGLTNKYGDSTGSAILTKDHSIEIKNLAQNTTYHFRVGGVDKFSNKVLGEDATFMTNKDTTGPKISDIKSDVLRQTDETGKEKIGVVLGFTTNEEATSVVEYAEGISMASYNKKTRENTTLNLSHSALIEGLRPATTYHYRIVVKDKYGNTTKSVDKTVLTPKESESVLQKIIKVLENTFSWVQNMRDYFNGKEAKK